LYLFELIALCGQQMSGEASSQDAGLAVSRQRAKRSTAPDAGTITLMAAMSQVSGIAS
jgi:hypothetical protein